MIAFLGAPTNLGLKPYDDGRPREVRDAPRVFRELGLVQRLGARDLGDVAAPPYRDVERPKDRVRNDTAIAAYSRKLSEAIAPTHGFLMVAGGDCSILLGSLLGLSSRGRHGLVFIDAHCDGAVVETSTSGAAAGMDLALVLGEGAPPLTSRLIGEEDVVLVGHRDQSTDHPRTLQWIRERNLVETSDPEKIASIVTRPELHGFWIHLDADVLDPSVMPAVDSPEPDGFSLEQLTRLLRPLVAHPKAAGMQVTIYDPGLDPDRVCGRRIVELLSAVML